MAVVLLNLNQPWSSDEELIHWFNVTYELDQEQSDSNKLKDYIWSRDVIQGWRVRSKCAEFETVQSLLTAEIEYLRGIVSNEDIYCCNIASLYSTALIQFCGVLRNYAADDAGEISRSSHSRSLTRKLAESLNVPPWIIDLRHEACHSKTPPLTLLRQASFAIQQWLRVNFWLPKVRKAEDFDFGKTTRLLQEYSNKPSKGTKLIIISALRSNHHKTLRVIVHWLTTSANLQTQGIDPDFQNLVLPSDVRKRMSSIIYLVFKRNLMHELLHLLINTFQSFGGIINISSVLWFKELMTSLLDKRKDLLKVGSATQEFSELLKRNLCIQTQFLRVAYHLTEKPMKFTPPLIEMFARLFTDTKYHSAIEKLASFTAIHVGCNGLFNGTVKKIGFQIKDVDGLRKQLSSKPSASLEKTRANKKVKFSC